VAPIRYFFPPAFKLVFAFAIANLPFRPMAQDYASLPVAAVPSDFRLVTAPEPPANTNVTRASIVHWASEPQKISSWNFRLTGSDSNTFSAIITRVGADRTEAVMLSPRVFAEDSLRYMNRDPLVLSSPENLAAQRGVSIFGTTAAESFGEYLDANYRLGGIWAFVRETFLDYPFERRIVSPLSPVGAGNPGEARTGKTLVHFGLRNLVGANPKGFITFRDRLEFDAAARGPSLVLRNPIGIDGNTIVTTLAAEYSDWNISGGGIPRVGATVSFLRGAWSFNCTASAGQGNFELSRGHRENRFEERLMFYARRPF
jgi:hypothetical protein